MPAHDREALLQLLPPHPAGGPDPRRGAPRRHRAVPRDRLGRHHAGRHRRAGGRVGGDHLQGVRLEEGPAAGGHGRRHRGRHRPHPLHRAARAPRLGQGSLAERIARAAAIVAAIHERSAGVWLAIVEASSADDEVDGWRLEMERGRRLDVGRSLAVVLEEPPDDQLVTMLWIIYSSETYLKLTSDGGFDRAAYEAFLIETSTRLIGERTRRPLGDFGSHRRHDTRIRSRACDSGSMWPSSGCRSTRSCPACSSPRSSASTAPGASTTSSRCTATGRARPSTVSPRWPPSAA